MSEQETLYYALENLRKHTQIQAVWQAGASFGADGQLTLKRNHHKIKRLVYIKKELRREQLIRMLTARQKPTMIIALQLSTATKALLREEGIDYLEANGNIYLQEADTTLWIETQRPLASPPKIQGRAFTKTGLKVVFQFLRYPDWLDKPYRQIAEQTGTGIGNVSNILQDLHTSGFLLKAGKNKYILQDREELIHAWASAYKSQLKPRLKIGSFRFSRDRDFENWQDLALQSNQSQWGAEPAAALLTGYLKPGELTLYSNQNRDWLVKNYRLIPTQDGHLNIYEPFWKDASTEATVPPLLIYADLLNTEDARCLETAQKIYEQYLQD